LIFLSIASILIFTGCQSTPNKAKTVDVAFTETNYGIYTYTKLRTESSVLSPTGFTIVGDNVIWQEKTTRIKAEIGTSFGFDYTTNGQDKKTIEAVTVITYPEVIRDSNGKLVTRYSVDKSIFKIGDNRTCGYTIESKEELLKGTWIMTVYFSDMVVLQRKFELY